MFLRTMKKIVSVRCVVGLLLVVNVFDCVSGTYQYQSGVPQLFQQQQGQLSVGVSSSFQPQNRIQNQGNYPQYFYSGGFSSSSSFPISQTNPTFKLFGNNFSVQQPVYSGQGQVKPQSQIQYHRSVTQAPQVQHSYPTTSLNAINVQIVPKGQTQTFNPQQNTQIKTEPQVLLSPTPSPAPENQNEPIVRKVTYLSSVATVVNPASTPIKKRRRLRVKNPQPHKPAYTDFAQFYNPQFEYYQRPEEALPITPSTISAQSQYNNPLGVSHSVLSYNSNNYNNQQPLGIAQGTASPFFDHVNIQYQQSPNNNGLTGRSVAGVRSENGTPSPVEFAHPTIGKDALVIRPNGGVQYYDPHTHTNSNFGDIQQQQNYQHSQQPSLSSGQEQFGGNFLQEQNRQFLSQINSNSLEAQQPFTPSTPYNPQPPQEIPAPQTTVLPQTQSQQPIQDFPPQYAPQFTQNVQPQQGFQPNTFPFQQFHNGQQQPLPFNPQFGQQGPGQAPFFPFPPPGPGQAPGQPPFEPENGFNPNFLQAFPEGPYESEFANEPPLNPQDEVDLEAYRARRRKTSRILEQQKPNSSQGSALPSPPPPVLSQKNDTVPQGCVYNTENGQDCVEVK